MMQRLGPKEARPTWRRAILGQLWLTLLIVVLSAIMLIATGFAMRHASAQDNHSSQTTVIRQAGPTEYHCGVAEQSEPLPGCEVHESIDSNGHLICLLLMALVAVLFYYFGRSSIRRRPTPEEVADVVERAIERRRAIARTHSALQFVPVLDAAKTEVIAELRKIL
jgi:hypothetical protein